MIREDDTSPSIVVIAARQMDQEFATVERPVLGLAEIIAVVGPASRCLSLRGRKSDGAGGEGQQKNRVDQLARICRRHVVRLNELVSKHKERTKTLIALQSVVLPCEPHVFIFRLAQTTY